MRVGDELAGRYRLEQRLGRGGMGEVWRAHDTALDRAVAVKLVLEAMASEQVVVRFRREATIGARLQHPGITVVHDVGQEDGQLFIVMELLVGEDLAATLSRSPGGLPVESALELAAQTAEALAVAHEQGVVHRDLKPANLFLLPDGRLKICDFGIAHSADATAGWTVTGGWLGTAPYMAPEQWRGEHVDARCDLYALGCVLYALLIGHPPFGQAGGNLALLRRHLEDPPLPLREAGVPVAPEVDRLVLHLLAKAPADRPESAATVAKALRGLAGPSPAASAARPEPAPRAPADPPHSSAPGAQATPAAPADAPAASSGPVSASAAGTEAVPAAVRELVRELLRDAESALGGTPPGDGSRVEVLAVAADAAARFDAELAGRLLAEAELAAWSECAHQDDSLPAWADGAQVARRLTDLAAATAAHAPARARRLLTDAQQALFTVPAAGRAGPLGAVAQQLAGLAPEQAARIAEYHFSGGPAGKRLHARIDTALAAADPVEAELRLAAIADPALRGAATYDLVLAVAPGDLAAALRLSERIGSAGGRLLALCQVAHDRAEAGDAVAGAVALEQAEEELPRFLEERAAWLREESAHHTEQGRLVQAERLRTRAANLLGRHPRTADDEKAGHALDSLARARAAVEQVSRPPLAPEAARERADLARSLPEAADRARALARIARECVATGRAPWLAELSADPGSPPPPGTAVLGVPDTVSVIAHGEGLFAIQSNPSFYGPGRTISAAARSLSIGSGRPVADPSADSVPVPPARRPSPGVRAWQTGAVPETLHAAGAHVVWQAGTEVGCVRTDAGLTRWTAHADEGAAAPPLPGTDPVAVSALADTATVYVQVKRRGAHEVRLLAREPRDGRVRWWRDLPGGSLMRALGPVLVHGGWGVVTGVAAMTGETLWQRSTTMGGGVVADTGDGLVITDGEYLCALDPTTGRSPWAQLRGGEAFERTPLGLVHVLDGRVVRALDRGTGLEVWQVNLYEDPDPSRAWPVVLVGHGTVFASVRRRSGYDVVYALDAETGTRRWQAPLELLGLRPGGLYVNVPLGRRRGLLNRSTGPSIAVLDPMTGKIRRRWEHPHITAGGSVLAGDHLVLSRPELTAYGLP
ncbi:protein kinase [Streptomyces sp. NPDC006487]|uniref:protein kinase domain-containing protein n=1 Tax=Streptomyces sp. NPDC006487 TaxID=3364748 RepID=UPI00367D40AD